MGRRLLFTLLFAATFLQGATPPDQPWQMRFDGRFGVQLPLDSALNIGSSYTFQLWIYPERQTQFATLFRKAIDVVDNDPFNAFRLGLNTSGAAGFTQSLGTPGSQAFVGSPSPVPLNTWTHLAITSENGTTLSFYVNGLLVSRLGGARGAPPVNDYPISLGADIGPPTSRCTGFCFNGFAGFMRQFAMWGRALSAAEIQAAMTQGVSPSDSSLAAYYRLDDGPGYSFRDSGPNHLPAARLVYPLSQTNINGTQLVNNQSQPSWLRTGIWAATPFDWTRQTQPAVSSLTRIFPIDFDSDGRLDLVGGGFFNPGRPEPVLKAYRNDGKGNFTDVTAAVFGPTPVTMRGVKESVVADLNHDGRPDIVIGDQGSDYSCCQFGQGQNRVFIQTADGRLVDETQARIPIRALFTHHNDGADIDGDGNVDLLFAEINACLDSTAYCTTLMKNDGSGNFTIDNSRLPQSVAGRAAGYTAFLDANRDGRPDIYLGYGEVTNGDNDTLLLNDGKGFFREAPVGTLPPRTGGANCATLVGAVIDLNHDGYPDLIRGFSCNRYTDGGYQVLINRGDGTFADATAQWLPDTLIMSGSEPSDSFPIPFRFYVADMNGDGLDDLIINPDHTYPKFYLNNGTGLVEASEFLPNLTINSEPATAIADMDGDGRPDLVFADPGNASIPTAIVVGLNKREAVPPAAPAFDAAAPWIGPMSILNEASMSADPLAPGTRIRIRGANIGPSAVVAFAEAPGATPPLTLGGVTVNFDSTPARLISVSSTELIAQVPFSLAAQWLSLVSVTYNGRTSPAIPVVIRDSNPQVYSSGCLRFYCNADAWKISGSTRTRITGSGQLKWGDRIAIRVTGAGQSSSGITDNSPAVPQAFVGATALQVVRGTVGSSSAVAMTPVSVTYAPEGLSGVVEVVLDLPATQPSTWLEFGVPAFRFTRRTLWPFMDTPSYPVVCTYSFDANGKSFPVQSGPAFLPVSTPLGCGWTFSTTTPWITIDSSRSGPNWSGVNFTIAANTGAPRSGTITAAGMKFTLTQAGQSAAPAPVINSVQDAESAQTSLVPGAWAAIYGSNLANDTRQWNNDDFSMGASLPTFLSGVTVTFGGKPAAVYYVSPSQISVQVPEGIIGTVPVRVFNNGVASAPANAIIVASAPSLFYYVAGGKLYVVATHTDYSLVGDPAVMGGGASKARPGEVLTFYVNGLAASPAGKIIGAIPYNNPVTVSFISASGFSSTITASYAGLSFAGGFQVNASIPMNLSPGDYKVEVTTLNKTSPAGPIIPVGP